MNAVQTNRTGMTEVKVVRPGMPAMKARTAAAGSQPIAAKRASLRAATAGECRRNIAGAPYYRGLRWDF